MNFPMLGKVSIPENLRVKGKCPMLRGEIDIYPATISETKASKLLFIDQDFAVWYHTMFCSFIDVDLRLGSVGY